MTREEIRAALLDPSEGPKEIRTNDGRVFRVEGVERWMLGGDRLFVLESPGFSILSLRNIASIGMTPRRGRRGRRRA